MELVLEHNGKVLLAKRKNEPAKGEWFWPGSRLYKGEKPEEATRRVGREELGIEIKIVDLIGVYSHFWNNSEIENMDTLHTVNIVYHVRPREDPENIALDEQHEDYKFISEIDQSLHEYVKLYLKDGGIT